MPGSPFSNVLGRDPGSSTFVNVESPDRSDTTAALGASTDTPSESSVGVEVYADRSTHVAEQDESAGDAPSGTPAP